MLRSGRVGYVGQRRWVPGSPAIGSSVILGVSVQVFLDESHMWWVD